VKPIILIGLCLAVLGCATGNGVDYRNFAIDTYSPTPNEIQLAEGRARNYWERNGARFGPEPRYLAVETSSTLFPYPGVYVKLINSETTGSFFSRNRGSKYSNLYLKGVMIYDTKTGHFVGKQGEMLLSQVSPDFSVVVQTGGHSSLSPD